MSTRILILVGSLRSGSDNLRLAEAAVKLAPSGTSAEIFEGLADVALYNEDIDQPGVVAAADRLRAEVQTADALLLVTPEYNGTMSGALKNAIDWISRPFGAGRTASTAGCGRTMMHARQHASRGQTCSMTSSCQCLRHTPASPASIPSTTRR